MIQTLLTKYADETMQLNSMVQGSDGQMHQIKIRNFQALIDRNYSHATDDNQTASQGLDQSDLLKSMVQLNLKINGGQDDLRITENVGLPMFKVEKQAHT
jgi:hypothetical protein